MKMSLVQDKVVRRCVVECFQSNLKGERLFESLTFYRHVLQKKMKHVSFALTYIVRHKNHKNEEIKKLTFVRKEGEL